MVPYPKVNEHTIFSISLIICNQYTSFLVMATMRSLHVLVLMLAELHQRVEFTQLYKCSGL